MTLRLLKPLCKSILTTDSSVIHEKQRGSFQIGIQTRALVLDTCIKHQYQHVQSVALEVYLETHTVVQLTPYAQLPLPLTHTNEQQVQFRSPPKVCMYPHPQKRLQKHNIRIST